MNTLVLLALAAPLKLLGPPEPINVMAIAEFNGEELVLLQASAGLGDSNGWVHIEHTHPMLLTVQRPAPLPNTIRLHLNSGEVFPGHIEASSDEDHLAWRHPWLGRLQFNIDDIAGVGVQDPPIGDQVDVITLQNGDQLLGFCATIGPTVVLERIQEGGQHVQQHIPWRRVRSIHLADANVASPVGCSAFRDGTIVRLRQLRRDADEVLYYEPLAATIQHGLGAPNGSWTVLALGDLVLPLAEATISQATPNTLSALVDQSGTLHTGAIRLQGEGVWSIDIPSGMTQLRAEVHIPSHLQHLAGGDVHFLVDGKELQHIQFGVPMDASVVQHVDLHFKNAQTLTIQRSGGKTGEVGATIDLIDGVLFGDH